MSVNGARCNNTVTSSAKLPSLMRAQQAVTTYVSLILHARILMSAAPVDDAPTDGSVIVAAQLSSTRDTHYNPDAPHSSCLRSSQHITAQPLAAQLSWCVTHS